MNQEIYQDGYTIYYENFYIYYDDIHKKLNVFHFDQNMVGFKDCPEDRYESHIKWIEQYKKEEISTKCYYLPKEVVDFAIKLGLEAEKARKEQLEEERKEAHSHPLKERFFKSSAKWATKEEMIQIILEHKEDAKNIYNVDLPRVEYYKELLNKYWS